MISLEAPIWPMESSRQTPEHPRKCGSPARDLQRRPNFHTILVYTHQGALGPRTSRWLPTNAGNLLRAEVLK